MHVEAGCRQQINTSPAGKWWKDNRQGTEGTESCTASAINMHLSCNRCQDLCYSVADCHPATNCICVLSWCLVISCRVLGVGSQGSPVSQWQSVAEHTRSSVSQLNAAPSDGTESQRRKERERRRESERWSSLPLSTDHNTRCWWHATPSPPALALGCISHYLHHFRCCNQQMEQPPWKVFLSFWANHSKVKGRKKTRQEDRMKKKKNNIIPGIINMYGAQRQSAIYNKYNTV